MDEFTYFVHYRITNPGGVWPLSHYHLGSTVQTLNRPLLDDDDLLRLSRTVAERHARTVGWDEVCDDLVLLDVSLLSTGNTKSYDPWRAEKQRQQDEKSGGGPWWRRPKV